MRGSGASRLSVAPGGALAGPWVRNPLWRSARAVPSLDLQFADNKSLVDGVTGQNLVTFTRASTATFTGSDGLIKTATTNESRFDHNPTTGESLGLLVEEARTNLILQSEDFSFWTQTGASITVNTVTAPDGTTTADLWTNTTTPGIVHQLFTKDTVARTYTGSLWVKPLTGSGLTAYTVSIDDGSSTNRGRAIFNLNLGTNTSVLNDGTFTNTSGTITRYPNNWYRLTVTTTTSTGTSVRLRPFFSTTGGTVNVWGGQIEEGSFPTSYIPTTTATVTRAADVASITGLNFSSWYNQTEGTVFAEAISPATSTTVFAISDGSTNNRIQIETGGGNRRYRITSSGTARYDNTVSYAFNTLGRSSCNYSTSSSNHATNGVLGSNAATSPLPVVDRLFIGANAAGSFYNNGTIKRLTYWGQRLPNNVLQQITQ